MKEKDNQWTKKASRSIVQVDRNRLGLGGYTDADTFLSGQGISEQYLYLISTIFFLKLLSGIRELEASWFSRQ